MAAAYPAVEGAPAPPYAHEPLFHDGATLAGPGSTNGELPPPYPTSLPDKFPIGKQKAATLVSVSELESHLRLLGAFDLLQTTVRSANPADSDDAWVVYLARAVYRFERWILANPNDRSGSNTLPPLDVMMVWHSYCLVRTLLLCWLYYLLTISL